MRPEPLVEPEIVFQSPLGLQDAGVGLQVHLPPRTSPSATADVVLIPSLAVHADPHAAVLQHLGELQAGELAPSSVLNTSSWPLLRASSSASAQKPASRVLDSRQAGTYRLCQSITATRELKTHILVAGFANIRVSASFDTHSAPSEVALIHSLARRWFSSPEMLAAVGVHALPEIAESFRDRLSAAIDQWKDLPDAAASYAYGEAIANKP